MMVRGTVPQLPMREGLTTACSMSLSTDLRASQYIYLGVSTLASLHPHLARLKRSSTDAG